MVGHEGHGGLATKVTMVCHEGYGGLATKVTMVGHEGYGGLATKVTMVGHEGHEVVHVFIVNFVFFVAHRSCPSWLS